ncbi:MAG: hypothetical protein V7L24_14895 [Nostoc sp.]
MPMHLTDQQPHLFQSVYPRLLHRIPQTMYEMRRDPLVKVD